MREWKIIARSGALGLVLAVALALPVAAQTTGAEVRGKISDATHGVLPGATIAVKNLDTGVVMVAVAEEKGQYRVPALPPGPYEIRSEMAGFATVVLPRVELVIGQIAEIDMTMQVAGFQEGVTVLSEAPIVNTTSSTVTNVVTKEQVASLPVLGRSWQELALLVPGTQQPMGTRGSFTSGGTTGRDPNVQMDGADSNDDGTGSSGLLYSQEAIREFNVMTNRFTAEYGRTQSAAVNVVSKSGTNRFSGSFFGFVRDEKLDAANFFTNTVQPFKYRQVGGSLGGPLKQNRAHFFVVYENQYESQMARPNTGIPAFDVLKESYRKTHIASGRIDYSVTSKHQAFVRTAYSRTNNNGAPSGKSTWDNVAPRLQHGVSTVVGENWVINTRIVNELRIQFNRWYTGTHNNVESPEYNFPSAVLGSNYRNPQSRTERRWQIRDDLSISLGDHAVRLGIDTFPSASAGGSSFLNYYGRFFFRTDPPSWTNQSTWPQPYLYRQTFGQFVEGDGLWPGASWQVFNAYVQDDWKVFERLTLNIGLRYDVAPGAASEWFSLPNNPLYTSFATDKNNWGPRIGATYAVPGIGRAVIRGGYGLFQDMPLIVQGSYRGLFNQVAAWTVDVRNPTLSNPLGGKTAEQLRTELPPGEIMVSDPNQDTPHTHQASAGFSAQLPFEMGLSADFVYVKGKAQFRWRDINLFENCQNVLGGCARPDPRYTRIMQYGTPAESEYKALLVSLNRRFRNNLAFQVSYTLSKSMNEADDNSSIADPPSNMFIPRVDWGPALYDQRHRLVTSISGVLPYQFHLSGIFTAGSGMPHKNLAGVDLNGDGSPEEDRPAGWTRNSLRSAPVAKVDVRLSRTFTVANKVRVEPMFEIYNLFNRKNYDPSKYGTVVGSAAFDKPGPSTLSFYQARQGQVAVKVSF